MYPLEDRFEGTAGGRWWRARFAALQDATGVDWAELARRIGTVEFHGYWSSDWDAPLVTWPSQFYGFDLVRAAMDRTAVIILTRARRNWTQAVPGLDTYPRLAMTHSQQNSALTEKNLGVESFRRMVAALGG